MSADVIPCGENHPTIPGLSCSWNAGHHLLGTPHRGIRYRPYLQAIEWPS